MSDWRDEIDRLLHKHHQSDRAHFDQRLDALYHNIEELKAMVDTVQQTIDANNTKLAADIDGMQTDLDAISAALKAAIPPVGTNVTQASVDAMTAQVGRLDAMKAAMDALVPATGSHTAEDTSDSTQNGQTRADGSTRNNFFLPNFNPANPETT